MKSAKEHMRRVADLPCACCGTHGVQLHHIREGQGLAQRASDWLVVPLCSACHTGQHGIHGDKAMMRIAKIGELDMLAETLAKVYG